MLHWLLESVEGDEVEENNNCPPTVNMDDERKVSLLENGGVDDAQSHKVALLDPRSKSGFKEKLKRLWKATKPYRSAILYSYFCIHCLIGAGIFYFVEHRSQLVLDSKVTSPETCIGGQDFWGAIFFSIAASSTVGFGILYPCTLMTRIIGILYAFVGIPLFIAVLAKFGDHFYEIVVYIYTPIWRKMQEKKEEERRLEDEALAVRRKSIRRMSVARASGASLTNDRRDSYFSGLSPAFMIMPQLAASPLREPRKVPLLSLESLELFDKLEDGTLKSFKGSIDGSELDEQVELSDQQIKDMVSKIMGSEEDEEEDKPDLPVSLGFLLILVCIAIMAVFYYYMEHFGMFDSVYYAFLTFLAGDFSTSTYWLCVPVYVMLFIGFSMVSTTISIVQNNIQNLMKRVKREVRRELQRQIADAVAEGREVDLSLIDTKQIFEDAMKKHGKGMLIERVIPERQMENFEQKTIAQCDKVAQLTRDSVGTQTEESTFSKKSVAEASLDPIRGADASKEISAQTRLDVIDEETSTLSHIREKETSTQATIQRTQKVQFAPLQKSAATAMTQVSHRDKSTSLRPAVQHKSSQSPRKVLVDKTGQAEPSSSHKIAQIRPSNATKLSDTQDLIQTHSQLVLAVPQTRTAKIQVSLATSRHSAADSTPSIGVRTYSVSERVERSARIRARWREAIKKVIDSQTWKTPDPSSHWP